MILKIKSLYQYNIIAFGGMGKIPLGKYPLKDLVRLAILAHQSKSKTLLNFFEGELPSLDDLQIYLFNTNL